MGPGTIRDVVSHNMMNTTTCACCCATAAPTCPSSGQVSEEVLLTRGDEDELKVKALEYAAPPGQRVWVKVSGGADFWYHIVQNALHAKQPVAGVCGTTCASRVGQGGAKALIRGLICAAVVHMWPWLWHKMQEPRRNASGWQRCGALLTCCADAAADSGGVC